MQGVRLLRRPGRLVKAAAFVDAALRTARLRHEQHQQQHRDRRARLVEAAMRGGGGGGGGAAAAAVVDTGGADYWYDLQKNEQRRLIEILADQVCACACACVCVYSS
jgi:hypothetical protein